MIFADVLSWFGDAQNWSGGGGVPTRVVEHLLYTFLAVVCASAIAVPVGLAVGHTGRGGVVLVGFANAMRALPTLGVVTFLFLLVRSEQVPTLIALVILAIPPVLAGTYAGVQNVERGVVDAASGMGMTSIQRLWQVEVPGSLPLMVGGIRNAILQVVATTTVAAFVGLGGLGRFLLDGVRSNDYAEAVAGAALTAALAVALDVIMAGVQRLAVPTGVRLASAGAGH